MASSTEGLRDILNLKDHSSLSTQPVHPSPNKQRLQHQHQQSAGHADHHEGFDEISLEVSSLYILSQPLWHPLTIIMEAFLQAALSRKACVYVCVCMVL